MTFHDVDQTPENKGITRKPNCGFRFYVHEHRNNRQKAASVAFKVLEKKTKERTINDWKKISARTSHVAENVEKTRNGNRRVSIWRTRKAKNETAQIRNLKRVVLRVGLAASVCFSCSFRSERF